MKPFTAPSAALVLSALALSACSADIKIGYDDAHKSPVGAEAVGIDKDCLGEHGYCPVDEHGRPLPLTYGSSGPPVRPVEVAAQVVPADFNKQIHDYLITHPEVIAEAQQALQQRQMAARQEQGRKALAENHDAVFADPADPVIGNPKGDVTIVEFQDPDCFYCHKFAPVLDQLIASDPGVRLVLKEYPILGPGSEVASRYALASIKQGKYPAFHAALMASTLQEHQIDEAKTQAFAKAVGLDIARLKADADRPEIMARITANRTLAQKLAITGTPGLIIGDQFQSGAMTLDALKKAVADARVRKTAASASAIRSPAG